MEGVAGRKGKQGVLQPTTFEHYKRGLPDFRLVDISPALNRRGSVGVL